MAELVDATDLKSVGIYSRAGSIPAFRTKFKQPRFFRGCFTFFVAKKSIFIFIIDSHKIGFNCPYLLVFFFFYATKKRVKS